MTVTAAPAPPNRSVDALTADGGILRIRRASDGDRVALSELFRRASPGSLRMRFFAVPSRATLLAEVERLCRPPSVQHEAVVGELAGRIVAVASYERTGLADRRAEFAVFVDDRERGRGIGTLLLEHLAAAARANRIDELVGDVLPSNSPMLRVVRDLTVHGWSRFDAGVVDVGVRTGEDDASLRATDDRERSAEHASLRPLLAPVAIAVVGAGRLPGPAGHEALRSLRRYGFAGPLYAVHPHAATVAGVLAYPSLAELPGRIDLVVIDVPADAVAAVLVEAAAGGARAAILLGPDRDDARSVDRHRHAELVRLARDHGIRLVGPNCVGVVNTDPAVRLDASLASAPPPRGGLAVAAQSGTVGIALLDHARRTGCGISSFVSLGDKADVSGNDLIAYWYDDPSTTVVALSLESYGNPRKFSRSVRALARRKPVLMLDNRRSSAGRRAGASRTAGVVAQDVILDALFAQAGVVRLDTPADLLDAARLLTDQPLPTGGRLAVVGNTGGAVRRAVDEARAGGLTVPPLSRSLRANLAAVAPDGVGHDNPVDLGEAATPADYAEAVRAVAASGEADCLLLLVAATRVNDVPSILAALAPVLDQHRELAVSVVVIGMPAPPAVVGACRAPVFDLPERAVGALGHAVRYAAWRRQPLGGRIELTDTDADVARSVVADALAAGAGWQPFDRTAQILSAYGIPLVHTIVVRSADLTGADQVSAAYDAATASGRSGQGVLVRPMVAGQVELVAGVVHDPLFGSLVMAGFGGMPAGQLRNRVFRLVPMTDLEPGRMWRTLPGAPLSSDGRGIRPIDTAAFEDLLSRLGRLAEDLPEVAELDLDPVVAGPDGVVVVGAKLRLAAVGAEPDATLRQLRAAD